MRNDTSGSRDTKSEYRTAQGVPSRVHIVKTDLSTVKVRSVTTTQKVDAIVVRYTPPRSPGKTSTRGS